MEPIVDVEVLESLLGFGDPAERQAFATELFQVFSEQAKLTVQEMATAASANDAHRVKALAHRLKGSAANLGCQALAAQAELIEKYIALSGDARQGWQQATAEIMAIFDQTIDELAPHMQP